MELQDLHRGGRGQSRPQSLHFRVAAAAASEAGGGLEMERSLKSFSSFGHGNGPTTPPPTTPGLEEKGRKKQEFRQ
jgi:hypothetical protein